MRIFHCDHCGNLVFFENTFCGRCNHTLAYLSDQQVVASLDKTDQLAAGDAAVYSTPLKRAEGRLYTLCPNYAKYAVCNWAVPKDEANPYCANCRLTQVIPDLSVPGNQQAWAKLEAAKRRLVYSLMALNLPVRNRIDDPKHGLSFEFKGDPATGPKVLTGHDEGIITVNIVEADDVERERRRVHMHEPYRTLLGHFRHEVGHYYWDVLVRDNPQRLDACRALFGDDRIDYNQSLQQHYANGPSPTWNLNFVSAYASVHPWEDWAETWAHYLHMTDLLETAARCGISLQPARLDEPHMPLQPSKSAEQQRFDEIIENWFPLTYALNALNRGMGLSDAYPFVLPPPTIDKLRFIHQTICGGVSAA